MVAEESEKELDVEDGPWEVDKGRIRCSTVLWISVGRMGWI